MRKGKVLPRLGGHRTLGELAYRAIRSAILTRSLVSGTRLVVDDLAKQLGVSRTPVKEALAKLEREGLVVVNPHRGARVVTITRRDMEEIYELREVVEGLAARLAARNIGTGEIEELRSLVQEGEKALARGDYQAYAEVDLRFHRLIRRASGNRRLQTIMENLDGQIHLLITTSAAVPGRGMVSVGEHLKIVEALEARDARRAEEAMREHVCNARLAILANLGRDGKSYAKDERTEELEGI